MCRHIQLNLLDKRAGGAKRLSMHDNKVGSVVVELPRYMMLTALPQPLRTLFSNGIKLL